MGFSKHKLEITAIVRDYIADFEVDHLKTGHIRITLWKGEKRRVVYAAGTPSDRNALANVRREIARVTGEMQ